MLLVAGGRRVGIGPRGLTIGRSRRCDLVIDSESVSRRHAAVTPAGDGFELSDLRSRNGTLLNGEALDRGARALASGDTITVGTEELRFVAGEETRVEDAPAAGTEADGEPPRRVELAGGRVAIGRDPANDVTLDDPNVSRFHAEVVARGGTVELRDLGSRNGTRLNGEPVQRAELEAGARIGVGPFGLEFDGGTFVTRDDRGAVRLEAHELAVELRDRQIVAPTSLCVESGELVAVIGSSGSGKTTLVKALTGVIEPSAGSVRLNDEPVSARQTDIGYVPQDEIVHGRLTPREALGYGARLRLPGDVSRQEVDDEVERTLEELSLGDRADRRIETLSGGERKRAGVAVELLGRPSILLLDEPTTGLDPDLESRMMELLRGLADRSRAVVVVTHSTRSLELCDRVAVVGPGGRLHFIGPPRDALEHFGVDSFDAIYEAVADAPPPAGADGGAPPRPPGPRPRRSRRRGRSPLGLQLAVLARRYVRLLARDRRNLAILLLQAPLLGAAVGALFGSDVFARSDRGNPNDAAQVLFLLVTITIWLGSITAAREIVKERTVVLRERAVGVRLGTYLASKAVVLFALAAFQTATLFAIVVALRPFHVDASDYAAAGAILLGTAFVAVWMGLLLSASARSEDQATSFIPIALLPQLLFAGAIVPVSKMGEAIETLSSVVFARWSFSALGTAIDMNARIAGDPDEVRRSPYKDTFFVTDGSEIALILAAFMLTFIVGTALLLRRGRVE
jgi:ABC-type multidrug transport system ATPase subunit/pSer/pThr/pTyr-binding forkhead associated (FHA) protein